MAEIQRRDIDSKKLKDLQAQYGGLISGSVRSRISEGTSVLVVGAGGMGCKTVNRIVREYQEHFTETSDLSWLAIDTNQEELDKINILNGGYVETKDTFPVYDPAVKDALKAPRSDYIRSFVSDDVPQQEITEQGANAVRCVGRVMLCASPKYGELLEELKTRIGNMHGSKKEIIFVAGISGGTGSGTFIDIGYMLRYLTRGMANTDVFGVFYTPDVQRNEDGIKGKPDVWEGLEKNGYAALKELDYFMSVGEHGTGNVYSMKLQTGYTDVGGHISTVMTSGLPIFENDHVFLVSATGQDDDCLSIITETAISLLNMFRRSAKDDAQGNQQDVLSNICNKKAHRLNWSARIGSTNNNQPTDPAGMAHTDLPVFMNYHYSSLGYRSVYIPRNEMAAYCLSLILNDLFEVKFKQALDMVTPQYVAQFEQVCELDSLDRIIERVRSLCGVTDSDLRLVPGTHAGYPEGGIHLKNGQDAIDETLRLAADKCSGLRVGMLNPANIERIWAYFSALLDQYLFNDANMWNFFGPYGTVAILTGHDTNAGRVLGVIDHLEIYATTGVDQLIGKLQTTAQAKLQALQQEKTIREADIHVTKEELAHFVDLCEDYGKASFELFFVRDIIKELLIHIYNYALALNNRTFATYIPMLEEIKEIINRDTTGFMSGGFAHSGGSVTYAVNCFTLSTQLQQNELFNSFFAGYINNNPEVQMARDALIAQMFSKENRPYWESLAMNDAERQQAAGGDAGAVITDSKIREKLRSVFSSVTKPLVGDMLQKLITMIYCEPNQFRKVVNKTKGEPITIDDLKSYWESDTQGRNIALQKAAERIAAELEKGNMIAFEPSVAPTFKENCTVTHIEVCSIPELGDLDPNTGINLNKMIKAKLPSDASFGLISDLDSRTEICSYMNTPYIPLPFVRNMRTYAEIYYKSESVIKNSAGRQGDEVGEKWQLYLPEIYGVDAEDYFHKLGVARFDRETFPHGYHDRACYEEIRVLADYALKNGILYDDGQRYHLFFLKETYDEAGLTKEALLDRIRVRYIEMLQNAAAGQKITWRDAVKALETDRRDEGCYHVDILLSRSVVNHRLADMQMAEIEPKDTAVQNLHRLIRSDLRTLMILRNVVAWFKEKNFFEAVANAQQAIETKRSVPQCVGYFLAAYRMGKIKLYHSDKQNKDYLVYEKAGKPAMLVDLSQLDPRIDEDFKWFLAVSVFNRKIYNNGDEAARMELREELELRYRGFLADATAVSLEWRTDVYAVLKKAREDKDDIVMSDIYKELGAAYLVTPQRGDYSYPAPVTGGNTGDIGRQILANIDIVLEAMELRSGANDRNLLEASQDAAGGGMPAGETPDEFD